jgi:GH24 family phage-related lysozyme (muramidase)
VSSRSQPRVRDRSPVPARYFPSSAASLRERFLPRSRAPTGAHLRVSTSGLDLLVVFEIGSRSWYQQHLTSPYWPGGGSGVTIGIGYDLGFQDRTTLRADWGTELDTAALSTLGRLIGLRGDAARQAAASAADVEIRLEAAARVFYRTTLPRYARLTERAYPEVGDLPADATSMLVSLIYNRGPGLAGDSRREMRTIRDRVPHGDLAGIAVALRAMRRLWPNSEGLRRRRAREAAIVAAAARPYATEELVYV